MNTVAGPVLITSLAPRNNALAAFRRHAKPLI